jgi:ethanolamine utilization protein EutM
MIETRGITPLFEATDAALKAADVEMLGWKKVGKGMVTSFLAGEVAAVKSAVAAGESAAARVGEVVTTHVIPRPHAEIEGLLPSKKGASKKGGAKK